MTNQLATEILNSFPRTNEIMEESSLLFPKNAEISYLNSNLVSTSLNSKNKDLLQLINIDNALEGTFNFTKTFSPRTYAESLENIPLHLTVQGLIFCSATEKFNYLVKELSNKYEYGKTNYDSIYITKKEVEPNSTILIMNRRVGGWDGSIERPVIELLGAGGHVPTLFDEQRKEFVSQLPIETIKKEAQEEIGITLNNNDVKLLGGFHNKTTSELVLLYGIFIDQSLIPILQENAYGNIEENIDGIYLGEFQEVMNIYLENATPFAGGEKSKATNFPTQQELMCKIQQFLVK